MGNWELTRNKEASGTLAKIINKDLQRWFHKLSQFAQSKFPTFNPPLPNAEMPAPPMPEFPAIREFVRGGGTIYALVSSLANSSKRPSPRDKGGAVEPHRKRQKPLPVCFS